MNTEKLSSIREVYESQVAQIKREERAQERDELERKPTQLREEEVKLGRLYLTGKTSEESYSQLRQEWQEKVKHIWLGRKVVSYKNQFLSLAQIQAADQSF